MYFKNTSLLFIIICYYIFSNQAYSIADIFCLPQYAIIYERMVCHGYI